VSRDPTLYLDDIVTAGERVLRYVGDMDFQTFVTDERTYDAVLRNLEVIGEAVKGLPEAFRALHPDVEWRKIAGMRDVLAHGYFSLDNRILWDAIGNKLPAFLAQVKGIVAGLS